MEKVFNNKYFRLKLIAKVNLHYGQQFGIYVYNRGVMFYIGELFSRKFYFPNLLTSFRFEILFFRYAIGIDFVKWKNYKQQ